jgi:phytanoyl-CoA hydroxylase
MLAFLRRLKLGYALYNFFHKTQLQYNVPQYKALGINKKFYSSVSSKDFRHLKDSATSTESAEQINTRLKSSSAFNKLNDESRNSLLTFSEKGFAILKNYFPSEIIDNINSEIDLLIKTKKVKPLSNNKIMFAYRQSKLLSDIGNKPQLKEILSALFGKEAILFQSINFFKGSEQHTHSDSIHMTTYPTGGLLGVWIALENIGEDNGPLHYYPGSHKLPYYMNADYNNEGNKWLLGNKSYTEYEEMIEQKIMQHNISKEIFYASKGDLLIWHANLFHGGEPHLNKNKTRKSMVFHYFRQGDICYHEITQRPALMSLNNNMDCFLQPTRQQL